MADPRDAEPIDQYRSLRGLSMPRSKAPNPLLAALYRLSRLLARIIGHRRLLVATLDLTWAIRRLAWEQAGVVFGEQFHNQAMGLTQEVLARTLDGRKSVLDVGCGTGRWSRECAQYASQILGVDYDAEAIAKARQATTEANVNYRVIDISEQLHMLGLFDVGLVIHVLEHLDDPVSFLQQLTNVCKSIIVEVPDLENEPLNWARLRLKRPMYSDADHVREYTLEFLREHLASAGWHEQDSYKRGGAIVTIARVSEAL